MTVYTVFHKKTTRYLIQGSGLGPVSYILTASDLHPMHPSNILFKYADDTFGSGNKF